MDFPAPNQNRHYSDRALDCEEVVDAVVNSLVYAAEKSGWSEQEMHAALANVLMNRRTMRKLMPSL